MPDFRVGVSKKEGFPDGLDSKESACNAGDPALIPGSGRSPGGGHGNPLQDSCLENLHGQRSLSDSSLWGCKESNMIERLIHNTPRRNIQDPGLVGVLLLEQKLLTFGTCCVILWQSVQSVGVSVL